MPFDKHWSLKRCLIRLIKRTLREVFNLRPINSLKFMHFILMLVFVWNALSCPMTDWRGILLLSSIWALKFLWRINIDSCVFKCRRQMIRCKSSSSVSSTPNWVQKVNFKVFSSFWRKTFIDWSHCVSWFVLLHLLLYFLHRYILLWFSFLIQIVILFELFSFSSVLLRLLSFLKNKRLS